MDESLVPSEHAEPPKVKLARTLDEATPYSLVHVDDQGRVRSPTRYRMLQSLGYVGMAGVIALPIVYTVLFGVAGAVVGGGLATLSGLSIRRNLTVQRAVRLIAQNRHAEAERKLEAVVSARFARRNVRAAAHQGLAVCCGMRSDFESALRHARTARQLSGVGQRTLQSLTGTYLEIHVLVNLDRKAEARALLEGVGKIPEGEYLRVAHWTAELYVCLAEGEHALSDDELYERSRKALSMTAGSALLGLCAWAHAHSGDSDQAEHLLREAFDRLADDRLDRMMPRLYAWMAAHRPAPRDDW